MIILMFLGTKAHHMQCAHTPEVQILNHSVRIPLSHVIHII